MKVERTSYPGWTNHPTYHVGTFKDWEEEDEEGMEEDTKANNEVDEIALREAEEKLHNQ